MMAQVLTSLFIFSSHDILPTLLDINLWLIVLATGFSVSGGYIFNAFFDEEKDLINRPEKTLLERHISAKTKLGVYFACSVLALLVASYVSFRTVLFFTAYMVAMFLYSSFLKRNLWFGTLTSTLLTILPFFAITVYYANFSVEIFVHAAYLYTLINTFFELNAMRYYFALAFVMLVSFVVLLWRNTTTRNMGMLLQFVRFILVLGIICLPLLRVTE